MTTYDFEGGTSGAAASTANTGGKVSQGTGNTMTVDNTDLVTGTLSLKIVLGNTVGPVNPTALSIIDYYSSTYPPGGAIGTTFVAGRYTRGIICLKVPVGGFSGTCTLKQFYGALAGNTTIGRLQAVDKVAGVQVVRFSNAAGSQNVTILADLTPYEGTWVAFRYYIDSGTTNADASGVWRFYANVYAAVNSQIGAEATFSAWDLGSATTTNYPIHLIRIAMATIPLAPVTLRIDYVVIEGSASALTGDTRWIAPPTAPSAPVPVLTSSTVVPAVGDTVTLTTSSTTGATINRTLAVLSYPTGTTAPTIANATTTTTTTLTGLQTGQTVIRLTAVGSSTVTTDLTIYTHPASNDDVGVHSSTTTTWTNEGGALNLTAAQNDPLDGTLAQSPPAPVSSDVVTDVMQPYGSGSVTVNIRHRQLNASGDTSNLNWFVNVYKEDGTTLVDSFTWGTVNANSGVWAEQPCIVDPAGLATLTGVDTNATLLLRKAVVVKYWAQVA